MPLVALVPDPVERVECARRLANWAATDESAVQGAVRTAVQRGTAPPIEPSRLPPRRAAGEERHFHELAVLLFREPALAGRFSRETLVSLLPEGSWKAVVGALLDAAESRSSQSESIDLFAIEEQLDGDARTRLREVAVDDELFRSATEPESTIDTLVGRLCKRRIDARQRALTRKMADPEADHEAILQEKNRLKLEGLAPTAAARPG